MSATTIGNTAPIQDHSICRLDPLARSGRRVTLRDGSALHIRPLQPGDRAAVAALFTRLSPQSLYERFHSFSMHMSDAVLDLVTADHALVATLAGEVVALGSYHPLRDPRQAEVAFVVDEDQQGRGIGTALYGALSSDAQQDGIGQLRAAVLRSNSAMLRVFQRANFPLTSRPTGDEIEVVIDLLPAAAAA